MIQNLPRKRALAATFASSVWIQLLTVISGVLTARLLQPEGRGLLAAVFIWPSVLGSIALLGLNNTLAISAARERVKLGRQTRAALLFGTASSLGMMLLGWFLYPWLVPAETLQLNRLNLLYIPLFILTAHLMAIDQGAGNFWRFNIARNVLNPVYLFLVLVFWFLGIHGVVWFVAAQLLANFAVLLYRLVAMDRNDWTEGDQPLDERKLIWSGVPFFLASVAYMVRDNIDRALLLFLLGPAPLGLYVVALTASGAHMTLSKSFNLVIFARSAALSKDEAMADTAKLFRMMCVVNTIFGLALAAALPWLIPFLFGQSFAGSVVPAMLLVVAQLLLAQGSLLEESLRAQSKPFYGVMGLVVTIAVFALVGAVLAPRFGVAGAAVASIVAQFCFCVFMCAVLKRFQPAARLRPGLADVRSVVANTALIRKVLRERFAGPAPVS
jgi:O-antigen/teichoic acid export membrane protein